MTYLSLYRARISFPDESRTLLDAGRVMARWAELAAEVIAPELTWASAVEEHVDYGLRDQWQAAHVVSLTGSLGGSPMSTRVVGRGESRLAAGGKGQRLGGTGRVRIETVRPVRRLVVDNHCDVTHWDITVGPVTSTQFAALRALLEAEIDAAAHISSERSDAVVHEPQTLLDGALVSGARPEDVSLWMSDLLEVGLFARAEPGDTIVVERAVLHDLAQLDSARITLGEILAEAGHEDWETRAEEILIRLPLD